MSERSQDAETLSREIEAAFADVPYPGDENLVSPESACRPEWNEVAEAFKGKHWRGLPVEFLFYHQDALSVFTTEAYRYYLPAYLLVSILNYDEADILPEYIIYGLNPAEKFRNELRQRIGGLTVRQRQAVISFLEFMRKFHGECIENEIDAALANLRM